MPKTEKELLARDAERDIGAELLQAARDLRAGRWARKTEFEVLKNGAVRRRIQRADGTVEKEEVLTGARWELMAARAHSGLSQTEFARALGVSKRTLENWEQGRAQPTGAARQLLRLAAQFPETVSRLAAMGH
ncbi:MAG: helix-turn-helix domain-containing protein [Lamprobacter sp.]|uniref:helix-turn-helix domain-containing protein n=1 Tax=Lamprobacter sp. TaxID=3100796 RepID=UPI002B256ABF|nr:helix-turn-helix domain-containing protein [Lamprobacter sp.]MEA3639744.1 helix-turn-helix domain-containing protein [Lamprobacter sp.]